MCQSCDCNFRLPTGFMGNNISLQLPLFRAVWRSRINSLGLLKHQNDMNIYTLCYAGYSLELPSKYVH
uniref:Uncharacterized protein n=1 Tax=Anguilla anguilla TaxID=7936 RepID=A0A0E9QV67_ANGAN